MSAKSNQRASIHARLISVNLYKAILPTVAVAIFLMLTIAVISSIQISSRAEDIVKSIEASTATYLRRYVSGLDEVYHTIYNQNHTEPSLQSALDAYIQSNNEITSVLILDHDGIYMVGSPYEASEVELDHSGHDYYKELNTFEEVFWSDVFITYGENKPTVTVSKKFDDVIVALRIDLAELTKYLSVFDITDNSYISITDSTSAYIAHSDYNYVNTRAYDPNRIMLMKNDQGYVQYEGKSMRAYHTLLRDTQWSIILYQSISDILIPIVSVIGIGALIMVLIGFRASRAVIKLNTEITDELDDLVSWTHQVAQGDYNIEFNPGSFKEFDELSKSFIKMTSEILNRQEQLESQRKRIIDINANLEVEVQNRTHDLAKSLEDLKNAQSQLVRKEKMAALGQLVSGVAHELNTPIGVTVTAASYLEREKEAAQHKLAESTFSKQDFANLMTVVDESGQIILRNMERASELITSFKQVAVDQQKMSLQKMNLQSVVDATVMSYSVELRKNHVEYDVTYDGILEGTSYPGAISQVLTNLMQNTILHAFDDQEDRKVGLECRSLEDTDEFEIIYWDNGHGIDEEDVQKIYDPFYTTALGTGGTGLGMNIVYNLVTALLGGEIEYENVENVGVYFRIHIPRNL